MMKKHICLMFACLAACMSFASWDGTDYFALVKDMPMGEFEYEDVTWKYYIYSNYNYSVVWPAGALPPTVVVPDDAAGYKVGEVFGLSNDSLWTLSVPGSLRELTADSFTEGTYNITKLVVRDDTSVDTVIGGQWPNGALFCTPNLKEVVLGEGVSAVARYSFNMCTNLVSVSLPNTLRRIGAAAFADQSDYYSEPDRLSFLEEDGGNFYIGNWLIAGSSPSSIRKGTVGIADDAMNSSETPILPDGIEYIGARSCGFALPESIPASVKFIGSMAFGEPYSWFQFGTTSFSPTCDEYGICYYDGWCFGPSDLEQWSYDEMAQYREEEEMYGNEEWYQEQIQQDWWQEMKMMAEASMDSKRNLRIAEGTVGIASSAFNASGRGDNNILTNIVFPVSLKYIGDNAFERCFALEGFNVASNLESIGEFAFSQCEKLHDVTLGKKVKIIPYGAFYEIYNLTNIYCSAESFETLSLYSYYHRTFFALGPGLNKIVEEEVKGPPKNLYIDSHIKYVGKPAWKEMNIVFEEGVTDIGEIIAGEGAGEITIPSTVTNIADNAFANCDSLTNLVLNIVNSTNVHYTANTFKDLNIKVVSLPYNAVNYGLLLATLGVTHVNYTVGTDSGFGKWVLVNGLAGLGGFADFGGKQEGKNVANGFLYVFGDNLERESDLIHLEMKDGSFVIKTPDEMEHEGARVRVLGSQSLDDWSRAIEMKQSAEGWIMPDGSEPPDSFFFKMEVLED